VKPPLDAWQVGPGNRWAYQHVDEMVPTVVVARGDGPVLELRETPLPLEIGDFLETQYVDGLAVLHEGALVLEAYRNDMRPDTLHLSQSVGKSVLGLLVGALQLDLAVPVTEHVPEVAGSGYDGATVQHLLDMTAAIDFIEDYATFWRYDVACAWHPPHPDAPAQTILDYLPTIGPAAWAHGERLHYSTPNTDLLGIVAERAGGAPLALLIARELWAPLGAERDALLTVDPLGTAAIGGGFCATLRDYARLGELVRRGGAGVVPTAWIERLGVGDPGAFARSTWSTEGANGYGLQWWRMSGRPAARGIHGQFIAVDHEAGVVVAILSSWPEATPSAPGLAQLALVDAVCGALRA
jgi:CubicO group peptidase (beta-lactamase class C family)